MKDATTWGNSLIELGRKQTALFSNDHMAYTNCLCTGDAIRNLMENVYCVLVLKKKLKRIEDWEQEEKEFLWNQTVDIAAGRLTREKMIVLSRVLATIEYFLNEEL